MTYDGEILDGNSAAEAEYQNGLARAERAYIDFCRDHPLEDYEAAAWDHWYDESGYEGLLSLIDSEAREIAAKRLLADALNLEGGTPGRYHETQRIRDYTLCRDYLRLWIHDEQERLRDEEFDRRLR